MGVRVGHRPGDKVSPSIWSPNALSVDPQFRSLWRGLVVAFPMWEGAGTRLRDVASKAFSTGVVGDPTWAGGPFGLAMVFDGDDAIEIANFDPPAQGTVFFLMVNDNMIDNRRIWGASDRFECTMQTAGKITNDCWQAGSGNTRSLDNVMVEGVWYAVAFTWDSNSGVATTQRIYLNGIELSGYFARALANDDPGTNTLSFGKRTGSDFFTGGLACWYLWDRLLSDGEQRQLARDPFGLFRMQRRPVGRVAAAGPTFSRSLAGSQPAATGMLARKEQAKRTLAGAQPAATGTLARVYKALRTLTGSQPAATGVLVRIEKAFRALAGSQPAASGTLARKFVVVRTLTGNQPAATGTLGRVYRAIRTVAGSQPAAVGVLVRIERAFRTLAGSQPAGTGTLVRVEKALRTLTGVQPSATGTLVALILGAPAFSPMAKDTGTISILGAIDATISITDEDETISIKTEDATL